MMVKEIRENIRRMPTTTSKTGSDRSSNSEKFICSSRPFQCDSVNLVDSLSPADLLRTLREHPLFQL
jgi:hypothetical protein